MNRPNKSLKWVIVFVISPLILAVGIFVVRRQQGAFRPDPQISARDAAVLRYWDNQKYTRLDKSPSFREALKTVPLIDKVGMTPEQRRELDQTFYDLIVAHSEGTYEVYRRYRTPVEATFDPDAIDQLRGVARSMGVASLPQDDEAFYRSYFDLKTGGRGYVGFWVGLNLENSEIVVEASKAIMPPRLSGYLQSKQNVGAGSPMMAFKFKRSADDVLQQKGELQYASVYLLIQPVAPNTPFACAVRFFWQPWDKKWVPLESSYSVITSDRQPLFN